MDVCIVMAELIIYEIILGIAVFFCFWNIGRTNTFWSFIRVIAGICLIVIMCMLGMIIAYVAS
jgi:hypothetical protein